MAATMKVGSYWMFLQNEGSIRDERETTIGWLVPTHLEMSRDHEALLCNDLKDNLKLDLV